MDFNDAEPQKEMGALIPEGTISLAVMTLRPGGFGDDGFIAKSKSSGNDMLDAEFTCFEGKYDRRKVWKYFGLAGDGAAVTRSQLRAALESAFNLDPSDASAEAVEKRSVPSYASFDGLKVCIKIGIEKGTGDYKDKNVLRAFVTPDRPGYLNPGQQAIQGSAQASSGAVAKAAPKAEGSAKVKPAWAN